MSTYQEIKAQISELENLAKEARKIELAKAKEEIAKIMSDYGLTIEDLGPQSKKKPAAPRRPVPAKFRNPETGETWTGRGRSPRWLDGKNPDEFLIKH